MLAALLLSALLPAGVPAADDSLMVHGISHALAEYRAAHVSRVHYDLALDVTRRDTAAGRVTVRFDRRDGGDVIVDFRGLALDSVTVNGTPLVAPDYNGAHLRVPAALLRDGTDYIGARFLSAIAPAGAAIIRFTDDTDKRDYLYTLLVPSDANLLFPCFDQPDLKATYDFTLAVPAGWSALANGAVTSRDSGAHATVAFERTRPIPTYLFAFAAGPFAQLRDTAGDVTLWVRASRAKEVDADTLIALNRRARDWMASYFGVPYPWPKLDFLLAPAFPFGGMEHPGAIFYNEESFIFREPPTLNQRLGRQATIDHEVAHQWFGDFTTMKWFDDLWLKEGFATYMAAKMQAATGDSTAWMSFFLRNKPPAYDVDASLGTTPIWQALGNLDQAKSNYGAIVYNKAPGVLKQLNYLVGEPAFQRGVHDFLEAHAYGNGTWQDLLGAIGHAVQRDLTPWGRQYFLRPGMPVVEQQMTIRDGHIARLALVQHPAQSLSGAGPWPMKLELLYGETDGRIVRQAADVTADTTVVTAARGRLAPRFVYANGGDYGYGLFMLDAHSVAGLLPASGGERVSDVREPFTRALLWGSLWDLVRDARLDPRRYVAAALDALPAERDEQIAARLMGRVARAVTDYLTPASSAPDRATLERAESLFLRLAGDSARSYGVRKNFFDAYVAIAHSPPALTRLNAWLDSTHADGMPLRQPTRWSIVTTLIARDWPTSEARLASETARDTTTGGRRRAFIAGAAFPRAATKRAYFERYFADSTLNEDWVTASLGAFNAPDQGALTLPYLRPALDTLPWVQRNRRIFFLGSWLGGFVSGQRSASALQVVDSYLREHPDLPRDLRQKVLQARDDLERTVRIRGRYGPRR